MLALVYKDLYQVRKSIMQILAIWGFFMIIAVISSVNGKQFYTGSFVYVYGFITTYSIMERILYNEDRYKGIYFMKILPLKKSMIVGNKFVTGLTLVILSCIISSLFSFLIYAISPQIQSFQDIIASVSVLFVFNLIYCGVSLGLFFSVGYAKSRQYTVIIVMLFAMLTALIPTFIEKPAVDGFLKSVLGLLNQPYTPFIFLLVGSLIYAACWAASLRVFKRKSYIS
ncbi:MAG: hypothetical protein PWP48_1668 [Clostridiales bacterium]|jgi:hypothetical protein|nr:hypothetical protein [Clostridiales bacterium]MDK2992435.1 hypothetical protein [Clostridiales bacterium]